MGARTAHAIARIWINHGWRRGIVGEGKDLAVENAANNVEDTGEAITAQTELSSAGINLDRVHSHAAGSSTSPGVKSHRRGLIRGQMDVQPIRLSRTSPVSLGAAVLRRNHWARCSSVKLHFVAPDDGILKIRPGGAISVRSASTRADNSHPIGTLI